jgi:ABC-type enterochelin transport system substrate-binding protein
MMKRFAVIFVISALLLTACGGRTAHPIKTLWPDDGTMSCEDISSEQARNNGEIAMLSAEKGRKIKRNIDDVCLFFCIFPLFMLDLTDTQNIEIDAYEARNKRLEDLALLKKCPMEQKK